MPELNSEPELKSEPELFTVNDDYDYNLHRQVPVTPVSHSVSSSVIPPLSVPDGWIIRRVPRSDGARIDTFYIDPETGRKFRSRYDIMKYMNPEVYQATKLKLDDKIKNSMDRTIISAKEIMSPRSNGITSKFTLPEDWFVEIVPRNSGKSDDKYYVDPVTGRKFRSLKDVERYLMEGIIPSRSIASRLNLNEKPLQTSSSRKMILSGGQMLDIEVGNDNQYQPVTVTTTSSPSTSRFKLPDGWIVEDVPRKLGNHCSDRYYYEPGTGKKFRSKTDVQKHLAKMEESSTLEEQKENNVPLASSFKLATPRKRRSSFASCKKCGSKKPQSSSFSSPPSNINCVVGSTEPEIVGERFALDLNNFIRNIPISGCSSTGKTERLTLRLLGSDDGTGKFGGT